MPELQDVTDSGVLVSILSDPHFLTHHKLSQVHIEMKEKNKSRQKIFYQ